MEVVFIGATRGSGTSKAGNEFEMCNLDYAIPAESFSNDKISFQKIGSEVKTVNISKKLFAGISAEFGEIIDLEMSPIPHDITKNYVTGIN